KLRSGALSPCLGAGKTGAPMSWLSFSRLAVIFMWIYRGPHTLVRPPEPQEYPDAPCWLHLDRASRPDCHHRRPDPPPPAWGPEGAGRGQPHVLHEQPAPDRLGDPQLSRHVRRLPPLPAVPRAVAVANWPAGGIRPAL